MSEWLQEDNIESDIIDVKKDQWPVLDEYQGLIFGTGIKIGQWTKEMKSFMKKNKEGINMHSGPKAFFVSSGYAAIPEKYIDIKNEYCRKVLEDIGVKIDNYEAFGGVMDVSQTSKIGWLDKKFLRIAGKESPNFEPNGVNDLRDWNKIEKFTRKIIHSLKKG
jgi:menaquinone-dependent protoporphyrinogen IX oxidase